MPTNVTREYLDAQLKYSEAKTLEEKIEALKLMLSTVPKHKGTERLRYELKKNLAKQRRELEARELKKVSTGTPFHVPREGIAQVALIGPTNSGRSLLLNRLTSSHAKVASYPFTTTIPIPGMLGFEDVQIQLVEMPALVEDLSDGKWLGPRVLSALRNADGLAIVLDLADHPVERMEMILRELSAAKMRLNRSRPGVLIRKTGQGGLQLEGEIDERDAPKVREVLLSKGYHNASVMFTEKVSREALEDALDESIVYRRALVIANKGDLPGSEAGFKDLRERFGETFPMVPVSAERGLGLELIGKMIYDQLGVIRLYTKVPGERAETRPMVLPAGSAVRDLAERLHKRFVTGFRFARVWGSSVNFGGEMVGLTHVLRDRDIVEVHAR